MFVCSLLRAVRCSWRRASWRLAEMVGVGGKKSSRQFAHGCYLFSDRWIHTSWTLACSAVIRYLLARNAQRKGGDGMDGLHLIVHKVRPRQAAQAARADSAATRTCAGMEGERKGPWVRVALPSPARHRSELFNRVRLATDGKPSAAFIAGSEVQSARS